MRGNIAFKIQNHEQTKKLLGTRNLTLEKCVDINISKVTVAGGLPRWQEQPFSSLINKLKGHIHTALAPKPS